MSGAARRVKAVSLTVALSVLGLTMLCELARADQACVYVNEQGHVVSAATLNQVPSAARKRAVCKDKRIDEVVAPDQLDVGRDVRTADLLTDLGPMKVRWPRGIERCFATPPGRMVGEAAQAVNRALRNARFTADLKYSRREWTLGFIEKAAALSQFPHALTVGRHPGFMIPPNRIYLIPDHISANCDDKKIADDVLTQVLLHEMGHVVEYVLMGQRQGPLDRERSEGFAVWFEQYSAEYARSLPAGQVSAYYAALARSRDPKRPFVPDPSGYANAGVRFQAIVDRKGVAGLMRVYELIRSEQLPFEVAVERALNWNKAVFDRQVQEYRNRKL